MLPSLTELNLHKRTNVKPILYQIEEQNEYFMNKVKPSNKRISRQIISEYGWSKNSYLDKLFKKYEDNYSELRIKLQEFMDERKNYLEQTLKNL